ncbi:MAG TPA: 4Fe-4S dicluster domain-containing protein [Burkholderiaceae bacterium]
MKTLICDCNHTMPLDATALKTALQQTSGASPDGLEQLHTLLCRREAGAFQRAAKATGESAEPLVVACTQERRLFAELNDETEGAAPLDVRPIRFVNIRETGGWSRDAKAATPKIAALLAAAQLPAPQAVPNVSYRSGGRCLIVGDADAAERAAALLTDKLDVNLLIDGAGGALAQTHGWAVHAGRLKRLSGWLGAFQAEWESSNPIDLDLCTRCNACIDVCPEGAIGFSYQIDLDVCKNHRDCVRVCDAAGAIDFQREPRVDADTFDLVLDLRPQPAFTMHQPPQGYFHVSGDAQALHKAVIELRDAVGEFEKPKFFQYDQKICAHSRNERIGCTACIDVCSARAISSDASLKGKLQGKVRGGPEGMRSGPAKPSGGIVVEPHLCVGCGACSTVCPSGAISFNYPSAVDQGQRLRTLLRAFAAAGGREPALLIHSDGAGAARIDELGRAARTDRSVFGVPARVLPVGVWHTASIGIDLWLAAFAQGANQVWVLLSGEEAPEYRAALGEQMAIAEAVLGGLGYGDRHFKLIEVRDARDIAQLDAALREAPATGVARAATFAPQANKRATLELAIDHLLAHAPQRVDAVHAPQRLESIALPAAGAPFGSLAVDTNACTMCLSCVGACPEGALLDNAERPQLRFIEKNCVQCRLCATTCPEHAIALEPRLWLADDGKARKTARVLHEVAPFECVRCGKPFGTLRAIEAMIGKLAGHSAFQGAAAERLKMCSDCRVIDMHTNPNEVRITDL